MKVVYRDRFDEERPFDREFAGLQRFEPVSRAHPGVVSILHVGRNDEGGYFYCVMELADAVGASEPATASNYAPRTLSWELSVWTAVACQSLYRNRACQLAAALGHLHQNGLVQETLSPRTSFFSTAPRG